jgi:hypothetical protein
MKKLSLKKLSTKNKGPLAVALVALFAFAAFAFLRSYNAVALLTRNKSATIEVDGARVQGEILDGKLTAIVTRRDPGKVHSYRLFFKGNTDPTGEAGFVIDCHAWVAPRLPFLPEVANYPPCNILSEDVYKDRRWTLFRRGPFIEFGTDKLSTIRIGVRNK